MSKRHCLLIGGTKMVERHLRSSVPADVEVVVLRSMEQAMRRMDQHPVQLLVFGPTMRRGLAMVGTLRRDRARLGVGLIVVYRDDQRADVQRHAEGDKVADAYIMQSKASRELGGAVTMTLARVESGLGVVSELLEELPMEALSPMTGDVSMLAAAAASASDATARVEDLEELGVIDVADIELVEDDGPDDGDSATQVLDLSDIEAALDDGDLIEIDDELMEIDDELMEIDGDLLEEDVLPSEMLQGDDLEEIGAFEGETETDLDQLSSTLIHDIASEEVLDLSSTTGDGADDEIEEIDMAELEELEEVEVGELEELEEVELEELALDDLEEIVTGEVELLDGDDVAEADTAAEQAAADQAAAAQAAAEQAAAEQAAAEQAAADKAAAEQAAAEQAAAEQAAADKAAAEQAAAEQAAAEQAAAEQAAADKAAADKAAADQAAADKAAADNAAADKAAADQAAADQAATDQAAAVVSAAADPVGGEGSPAGDTTSARRRARHQSSAQFMAENLSELGKMLTTLQAATDEISRLEGENLDLQDQIEALEAAGGANESALRIAAGEAALAVAHTATIDAQAKTVVAEAALAEAQGQIEASEARAVAAEARADELKSQVGDLRKAASRQSGAIAAASALLKQAAQHLSGPAVEPVDRS